MRRLVVFNSMTLDGYFVDLKGDMSWAHKQDPEWTAFTEDNASGESTLLFGRKTYEMMASWWPTPDAMRSMPAVAERMNRLPKVVFSRTLDRASWSNTTLVGRDMVGAVRNLKKDAPHDLVILGSGTLVSLLTREGLIDEYQVALCPVVLGTGRTMFDGLGRKLDLRLMESRAFSNGNVFLRYEPAR